MKFEPHDAGETMRLVMLNSSYLQGLSATSNVKCDPFDQHSVRQLIVQFRIKNPGCQCLLFLIFLLLSSFNYFCVKYTFNHIYSSMGEDKTVYLADDDEDDRYLFKEAVEKTDEKVKVVESDSGEELIQQSKESEDLSKVVVVVDHNMPAMTGLETIESIKSDPEISEVPTVMMSTSSNPVLESSAIHAGADLFITKPFSFMGLVETVKKIFRKFFK